MTKVFNASLFRGPNRVLLALAFQADPFVSSQICPSSILFFSRRFFGSHNCKLILYATGKLQVFPSILALLRPFCYCALLLSISDSWEVISLKNDNSTFVALQSTVERL